MTLPLLGAGLGVPGGGGPTPLQVLQSYNPYFLYDHLYSGSVIGVTNTPPADGEEIATWNDLSGNNRHLTGSGTTKPIYRTSGTPGIEMGTTGIFTLASSFNLIGSFTIYAILYRLNGGVQPLFGDAMTAASSAYMAFIFPTSTNRFRLHNDAAGNNQTNAITVNGLEMIRVCVPNAASPPAATFAATSHLKADFNTSPSSAAYTLTSVGCDDSNTPSETSRIRHLSIIPGVITASGVDDIAIKAAMNSMQSTALTISGE